MREAGAIRIQRIPSTERKGRVHSSTVTIAVRRVAGAEPIRMADRDVKVEWYSGSGAGGQNRNKVQACARVTHLPTGIVRTAQTRSRQNSLRLAMAELEAAVRRLSEGDSLKAENAQRRSQIGSGQRADKGRTFRFQDDSARDHGTGATASLAKVMRGHFDLLWR